MLSIASVESRQEAELNDQIFSPGLGRLIVLAENIQPSCLALKILFLRNLRLLCIESAHRAFEMRKGWLRALSFYLSRICVAPEQGSIV